MILVYQYPSSFNLNPCKQSKINDHHHDCYANNNSQHMYIIVALNSSHFEFAIITYIFYTIIDLETQFDMVELFICYILIVYCGISLHKMKMPLIELMNELQNVNNGLKGKAMTLIQRLIAPLVPS